MHFTMKKELKHFSVSNRRLQKQFFKALVAQTLAPTFLFVIPAAPILLGPLLDTEMSIRTGTIYVFLNLYPPIDSIAFMVIVSEYKQVISDKLCDYLTGGVFERIHNGGNVFSYSTPFHCGNILSSRICLYLYFHLILIYLTAFHTERITGAYKYLIILFSLVCISFSCLEVLAHPYLHNYNGGFIYFSLNDYLGASNDLLKFFIEAYSGAYASIMCMVAVQFVFRFATLMNRRTLLSTFSGANFVIWILYPLFFCIIFGMMVHYCAQPEPYSDNYMQSVYPILLHFPFFFRKELFRVYNLEINKTARFIVIAYNADGSVRWFNLIFLFGAMIILGFQYAVIIYCGVQMQRKMKKELKNFSLPNRKLQQQFFKALVVQITLPTLLFHLPALPVLFSPFFNVNFTFQTGFIYAVFSLYPPIETIAFMLIVSEYTNIFKKSILRRPSAPDVRKRVSSDVSIL
ncbi:hypothetical protein CAEBREN_29371 [Caenorhabditis brenneri]|uniref:Uncharacterized protein n=1 Tax=Caenorhabditis brenneri TaxID=135651 RepID=G0NYW4_CAEBE|nr:hypothetical protein CAEBREN_29371 [Caenorhabditis brenneri]